MEQPLYRYNAEVLRTVDGDTLQLLIDEGFRHYWKVSCRLKGINAPELRSTDADTQEKAQASKDYLETRLPAGTKVYIISRNLDKYGRPEVDVFLGTININKELIKKGFAVKY